MFFPISRFVQGIRIKTWGFDQLWHTLSRVQQEGSGAQWADKAPDYDRGKGGYGKFHSS